MKPFNIEKYVGVAINCGLWSRFSCDKSYYLFYYFLYFDMEGVSLTKIRSIEGHTDWVR